VVYFWRASDAEAWILDVLVQSKRNKHAALKLMRKFGGSAADGQFPLQPAKDMAILHRPWHNPGQAGYGGVCAEQADR